MPLSTTNDPRAQSCEKSVLATLGIACFFIMGLNAKADSGVVCEDVNKPHQDCCIHNMMVVGQKSVFYPTFPCFSRNIAFK